MDKKKEDELMRILKTHLVRKTLCKTPLGELELLRLKGEENYTFTLDSVPLDKDTQVELNRIFKVNE